jgi:hypothetical protein
MNLKSQCAVCGVVACGIVAHLGHVVSYPEGVSVAGIERPFSNHPETPERGDQVREPQVAGVTSLSAIPVSNFIYTVPQHPPRTPDAFIFPNVALQIAMANTPTDVSSKS